MNEIIRFFASRLSLTSDANDEAKAAALQAMLEAASKPTIYERVPAK